MNLPLFDERPRFDRERLAARLASLAAENIYIGTSSWKYEGWCGQIYSRDRYSVRGRFSRKRFDAECLREYGEVFPVVCGDFSFYQFPTAENWKRLFDSAGDRVRFALKAPEDITARQFPVHPRYGPRGGERNGTFLNADLFGSEFLHLIEPYRERVAAIICEFGAFPKGIYEDASAFTADLDPFLAALPGGFRYSVELRSPELLERPYFDCLRRRGAAHVFNGWSRMPELQEQMAMTDAWTADFSVTRALLRRGRPYEQAVAEFSPYERIQDENTGAREAMREQIRKAREKRRSAYIFVNNRLEGNAPLTIESIIDD
jgi:uncharacterized protein YecE (DUF72 family)